VPVTRSRGALAGRVPLDGDDPPPAAGEAPQPMRSAAAPATAATGEATRVTGRALIREF
jgi:hypothetical protein